MKDPLRLRKSFKAGTKNDSRDVEKVTEALRVTGFLPRQKSGAPAPSEAAVGGAAEVGALRRRRRRIHAKKCSK